MAIALDWTPVFIDRILHCKLPKDKVEVEHVTRTRKNYVLVGDKLYQCGTSSRVLKMCTTSLEGREILEETHSGCCCNLIASITLVGKVVTFGYIYQ